MNDIKSSALSYAISHIHEDDDGRPHYGIQTISAFEEGADLAMRLFLDKACNWLETYAQFSMNTMDCTFNSIDLIIRFREAMSNEQI